MAITSADIKLLESERMTDSTDGGGRATANAIPDGVNGNIFPKVSRLDAVNGRVNLRKIYGKVDTPNVDTYAGAHLIVTDPPDNEKISVCAFKTSSYFDTRTEARDRIESYVLSGPEARLRLYGRQPAGAKSLLCYQRKGEALPDIGDVFALTQLTALGVVYREQYVRVDEVATEVREFEDDKGLYAYAIVSIKLTAPLEFEFYGPDTPPRNSQEQRLGLVRTTTVADVARYYGVQPLAEAVTANALQIRAASVFTPLVPTTTREVAVSLATIGEAANYIASGTIWDGPAIINPGTSLHFPTPVRPGSVTLTGSSSAYPARDDGQGGFVFSDGISRPLVTVGYDTGTVIFPATDTLGVDYTALISATCNAESAAPSAQPNHTYAREVTLATRGTVYSELLDPPPAPGTLIVDFRALGKWYRLRDDGAGVLAGEEPSIGTGTIDYASGAVLATLGAQPDNETSILYAWGSTLHYAQDLNNHDTKAHREIQLSHIPVASGSLSLALSYWPNEPVTLTFTTDTATHSPKGLSATLDRTTGKVVMTYGAGGYENLDVPIIADYEQGVALPESSDPAVDTTTAAIGQAASQILLSKAVKPGSVRVTLPMIAVVVSGMQTVRLTGDVLFVDDGSGALRSAPDQSVFGYGGQKGAIEANASIGSINYSTGTIDVSGSIATSAQIYRPGLGTTPATWVASTGTATRWNSYYGGSPQTKVATVTIQATGATITTEAKSESFALSEAPLKFDLTQNGGLGVVPGSVCFTLDHGGWNWTYANPATYVDRGGQIIREPNRQTGTGTLSGSINYTTGEVTLTSVYGTTSGQAAVDVLACVTYLGDYSTDTATFRTTGAPVKPASLYVRAVSTEGAVLTGTSDVNGIITGDLVTGTVQQSVGVVDVRFGEWMPVSGNEAEPWYDADNIDPNDPTQVWKSTFISPATLTYSCVLSTSISLDSAILGLDPVRLPLDGRVPIFRPGDVAVVHNTQSFTLPNNPAGGSTHNVGRTGLTDLWLIDQDKVRVDPANYSVDVDTGVVTMASGLNLAGYVQPLIARHRISDMALITDVQIDGRLDFAAPLVNAYPEAGSYVSSALLFGDLYGRVSNVFDQGTWTGVWSDSLLGDQANAQYNDVSYPIEILNDGAVQERWRIQFTSGTAYQCFGEQSGMIATGSTGADFAPLNPLTNLPYFTVRAAGWGGGWSVGNQLRFNTYPAGAPIWLARTILPGAALTADSTDIQFRGDVDA